MSAPSLAESPLNLLLIREQDNIAPGENGDGSHIDIAFDGGGTGGIVELGFADVIKNEGIFDRADSTSGTSIGAHVAAVSITGQIPATEKVVINTFAEQRFINIPRMLLGRPMVRLPILRNILERESPLDTATLMVSPMDLHFGVTNLTEFKLEIMSKNSIREESIIKWLMRAVHLPRIAGKPPVEKGIAWADGGLTTFDTPDLALASGATHVMNVANKPKKPAFVDREFTTFVGRWIQRYGHPNGLEEFRRFSRRQVVVLNSPPRPNVQTFYPDDRVELPDILCKDPRLLRKGFIAGQNAAWLALGHDVKDQAPRPEARRSLKSIVGKRALRTVFALAP